MDECPGCEQQMTFPHQHASVCPVFAHADCKRLSDFIECGCGHLSVSYVDHNTHLEDVARRTRNGTKRGFIGTPAKEN
jgi:hypothetical protein